MAVQRLLAHIEARGLFFRLTLAWVLCALPRIVFARLFHLGTCYRFFMDGDTDSAWYPLYEGLASLFWTVSGGHLWTYFALHLVLHALIGPLVYVLTQALGLGARTAWLAVAGVAFMPYYVSVGSRQPQVGVTIVALALISWIFVAWQQRRYPFGWGALFAAASFLSLTLRPNVASVVGALYALALFRAWRRSSPRTLRATKPIVISGTLLGLLLVGMASVNYQREGRFSPFTGNLGFNLYVGNNPDLAEFAFRYDITSLQDSIHAIPPAAATSPIEERDRVFRTLALEFIRDHPGQSLWNALLKSWRYWDVRLEDAALTPLHENLAYTLPYLGYGLLSLFGAWVMWRSRNRDSLVVIATVVLTYWAPHVIFFGTVRMRMTAEFLLVMLAAYALASWTERRSSL
jgi:hypothetical protein